MVLKMLKNNELPMSSFCVQSAETAEATLATEATQGAKAAP